MYNTISNLIYTNILIEIIRGVLLVVPLLITVAFYTLFERKAMASIQRRKGPNVVGIWGFLQPLADGLKLIFKEIILPRRSNVLLFILAPMITFFLSVLSWAVLPFDIGNTIADINCGVLFILAISSLNVYGVILAGWSSNSKYSMLGALRAAAQMISYEITISLSLLPVIMLTGSLNLSDIVYIQCVRGLYIYPLLPLAIIFFISVLAETNRAPFDMAEAEAEIVAGYNLEYSSIVFAMFFLGEYSNMILMSSLFVIFFLGGSYPRYLFGLSLGEFFFALKTVFICFFFILVRAMLPRYRFDQLMSIGWKVLLPIALGYFVFCAGFLVGLDIDTSLFIQV